MATTIPSSPTPPIRGVDSDDDFASKCNNMMAYLPQLANALNAFADELNGLNVDTATAEAAAAAAVQAAESVEALAITYQEASVVLGGTFNSVTFKMVRIGNTVTINATSNQLQANNSTSATSNPGIIPAAFRPSQHASALSFNSAAGYLTRLTVNGDGTVTAGHYDMNGDPASAGVFYSAPISYVITDEVN